MTLFNDPKEKVWIKDLAVGQRVDSVFKILESSLRPKRDGGKFLTVTIMDRSGRLAGKIWENVEFYQKMIKAGLVYRIKGIVNSYQNNREIKIDSINNISPSGPDIRDEDFQEQPGFDTAELMSQVEEIVENRIDNPIIQNLCRKLLKQNRELLLTHYGAMKIHHAYIGGLLKHIHSMLLVGLFIAEHYSLDRDLLTAGILLHDLGKLKEFQTTPATSMTAEGGLIGHIAIALKMFHELKGDSEDFPEELSLKLQHMIISHHGEREFGSAEVPKTPEAYALHLIDLLDSKMNIISEQINSADPDNLFSEYIPVLGRRLYISKGKKENEENGR